MNAEREGTSDDESQNFFKSKVVFLGEQNVGKSSLITRFMINDISRQYVPTIGIDFFSKNIEIDGDTVRLQIWDTAGQERFRSLIPSYLRDADIAVIVFDVTCARSFARSRQWFDYVNRERRSEVAVILVGNKCDLTGERQISTASGTELSKGWKCRYLDVSASTGENVNELFMQIARAAIENKKRSQQQQQYQKQNGGFSLVDEKEPFTGKSCFC